MTLKMSAGAPREPASSGVAHPGEPSPRISAIRVLRGANGFHHDTVLELEFDLGRFAHEQPFRVGYSVPDFLAQFDRTHLGACRRREDNAFLQRLLSGAPIDLGEFLLAAILELEQRIAELLNILESVSFATISSPSPSKRFLVWQSDRPILSRKLAEAALEGMREILGEPPGPIGFRTQLEALEAQARRRRLSSSTALLMREARRRGFPVHVSSGQNFVVGYGTKSRSFTSSITPSTATGPSRTALSKELTCRRLREASIPVPDHKRVSSLKGAMRAAELLGYPLVVKPLRSHSGRGVIVGVQSSEQLQSAFLEAKSESKQLLVERLIDGDEHRMLVVGERLVAVVRREPPRVVGDGAHTVRELIQALNADPRRNKRELHPVALDNALEKTLAWQDLTLDAKPEVGRLVMLSRVSNQSKGGKPIDVTDVVHPDNAQLAVNAARAIGLDVAGIDLITRDISRSWREVAATVIEVNARPGIHIHGWPSEGTSRDVARPIMQLVFPDGSCATPPTFVVGGDRSTAPVAKYLAQLCQSDGKRVGICLGDRAYVDNMALDLREGARNEALPLLMRQPDIEAFVIAASLRRVSRRGLYITRCNAAAIMPMLHGKMTDLFDQGVDVLVHATAGPIAMRSADGRRLAAAGRIDPAKLVLVDDSSDDNETRQWIAADLTAAIRTWRPDGPYVELYSGGSLRAQSRLATRAQMRQSSVEANMFAFAIYYAFIHGLYPAGSAQAETPETSNPS